MVNVCVCVCAQKGHRNSETTAVENCLLFFPFCACVGVTNKQVTIFPIALIETEQEPRNKRLHYFFLVIEVHVDFSAIHTYIVIAIIITIANAPLLNLCSK